MVSDDPPYIPPSEDMSEDERELTQAFAELLWWMQRRSGIFDDSALVDPREFTKKVIELGWVPETELRRAEYARDVAEAKLAETVPDELEEPDEDDDGDIVEVLNGMGQVIASYPTRPMPAYDPNSELARKAAAVRKMRKLRAEQSRIYNKNYKWKDL